MLLDLQGPGPLYRRLYHALKSEISTRRLPANARLPSTRALAADLGLSRNTVVLAYEQLAAEGYLVSRPRAALRVAEAVAPRPAAAPPPDRPAKRARLSSYAQRLPENPPSASYAARPGVRYDFRYGAPAVHEFPREVWRRLLAARARRNSLAAFGYGPPAGYAALREALAGYLGRARGVSCDAEQIVIVNGSQQAFDLCARVLLDAEDAVVVEEPGYPGARLPFEAAGARCIAIEVDAGGMNTDKLPRPRSPLYSRVRLACVTPCHQFPSGVVMPAGRRRALLDWAARTGAWIVEDDYVSEFRYAGKPLEALQALDRAGRVIYVGTFSKTLFPALRLAYLVLPRELVKPFVAAKWMSDRYSAMLGQEALADFIAGGHFERYLRRSCARNGARRRVLIQALREKLGERIEIAGENAGVHLVVWLNGLPPSRLDGLIARAARAGVGLYPVNAYHLRPPKRAGLLFGYAALTENEIRAGVRLFAGALAAA
jgi:GntR family transcriptional regulator/MocR family aminotransferase